MALIDNCGNIESRNGKMTASYRFTRTRSPGIRDYAPPMALLAVAIAIFLEIGRSALRSGDYPNLLTSGILVLPGLFLFVLLIPEPLGQWTRFRRQATELAVDEQGLSFRDRWGTLVKLAWPEIERFEFARIRAEDLLLLRAGKLSGSISLMNLDTAGSEIFDIIRRCSGRDA